VIVNRRPPHVHGVVVGDVELMLMSHVVAISGRHGMKGLQK
jgi:hypothetical protein